jgi:general secretion pathway protein K
MRQSDEDGIALIAVLWLLVLLSLVAAALAAELSSSTRVARNMVDSAGARAAADAGIQRAIMDLTRAGGGGGGTGIKPDGIVYAWKFAGCTVRISVRDEASKIDLNLASEPVLASLFRSVGVPSGKSQSLADAIADFRDPDNMKHAMGAEEADYRAAKLSWGPRNGPFQSLEDLQQVFGMTPALYRRVLPNLTIYSVAGGLPGVANDRMQGVLRQAGVYSQQSSSAAGIVFSIRSEARSNNGTVFVREAVVQPVPGTATPWILSWRQGAPEA